MTSTVRLHDHPLLPLQLSFQDARLLSTSSAAIPHTGCCLDPALASPLKPPSPSQTASLLRNTGSLLDLLIFGGSAASDPEACSPPATCTFLPSSFPSCVSGCYFSGPFASSVSSANPAADGRRILKSLSVAQIAFFKNCSKIHLM